jgi:hypothetical protein
MDTNTQKRATLHTFIYLIVLFSLLASGGFIRVVNEKTFYQEDIKLRETTSIKFGCASGIFLTIVPFYENNLLIKKDLTLP